MHPKTHPLALSLSGALALSLLAPPVLALNASIDGKAGDLPSPAQHGKMADNALDLPSPVQRGKVPQAEGGALDLGLSTAKIDVASGTGTANAASTRYMILLREPALASYHGDSGRLAAPPRIASGVRKGRLDLNSGEARDYVQYLAEQQSALVVDIEHQLGRTLPTTARLQHALNGIVAELTPAEAALVAARSDVARVEADTILPLNAEPNPSFIGADKIWNGSASGGVATQGEGIVVGVIDSGINWQNPSFAAIDPVDSYQHINPLGSGSYLGGCAVMAPNPDLGRCNDKLIGMYNFVNTANSAADSVGHGSHTSSIAGGNHRVVDVGGGSFAIAGVAPRANIIMFSCFSGGGCSTVAAAQSANQAVADGLVDVLNYSVAGGTSPWSDMVSQAFLGATEAGIFIAAAGGNDGPDAQSVNHIEPWVTTVAASTLDYTTGFDFSLDLPGGAPANTQHIGVHPGQAPMQSTDLLGLPLVRSPNFSNLTSDGCSAFASDTFTGSIAVLRLRASTSSCSSAQRQSNAMAAGAVGVLFVDANAYLPLSASGATWSMLLSDWENVWSAMQANPGLATVSIKVPLTLYPDDGDHIADFSGRGPNVASDLAGQYLLKPDLSAPGVAILAAYVGSPDEVDYLDGTSMASPHIAGAGALLRAVHPDWTPMEIKSALMTTSWTNNIVSQWGGPTTPWDRGAGRVDLSVAARAGLLLDETGANFRAADPALGGSVSWLNLPSAVIGSCTSVSCGFTRRVRNPLNQNVVWTANIVDIANATVTPSTFSLAAGATQDIQVSINPAMLLGTWKFGQLELVADDNAIPRSHLPVIVKRNSATPLLLLSVLEIAASVPAEMTTTRPITLSNVGNGGSVRWSVNTTENGCTLPAWASPSLLSGTLLSGSAPRTVTTTFNAQGLNPGIHSGTLCIASDDASLPLTRVNLRLNVQAADTIFAHGFEN